jgi:hypothetical protein
MTAKHDDDTPPPWRKREGNSLPVGKLWVSDGNIVWLVESVGSEHQFAAASMVVYWMPAAAPAPPKAG